MIRPNAYQIKKYLNTQLLANIWVFIVFEILLKVEVFEKYLNTLKFDRPILVFVTTLHAIHWSLNFPSLWRTCVLRHFSASTTRTDISKV